MAAANRADGRSARAQRSREAVARAVLSLLDDGNLRPTRQEVADRAGVSLRLVHLHFREREQLYAAAARLQNERISAGIAEVPRSGSFAARLKAFVRARAEVLEAITPVRRAASLEEPFSDYLRQTIGAWRRLKRDQVGQIFAPELRRLRGRRRTDIETAAACAASWSAWDELRRCQDKSYDDAARVMRRTLDALLGGSE
jgi:AcrR family transcriptional regulator